MRFGAKGGRVDRAPIFQRPGRPPWIVSASNLECTNFPSLARSRRSSRHTTGAHPSARGDAAGRSPSGIQADFQRCFAESASSRSDLKELAGVI